jgi:hypothetical protein
VCDSADSGNCATDTTTVTVNNVDPTITAVTNDGPIDEGSSATITVTATDPADVNDPLQYEFDCDSSGGYEVGPQVSNSTLCSFADDGSFTVPVPVPVRVTDGDGGSATDSTTVTVEVVQTVTVCLNYGTGAVSLADGSGCGTGTIAVTVPGPYSPTLCISGSTTGLRWAPNGVCVGTDRAHVVPDDGPLYYCERRDTGALRVPWIPGQCLWTENPGVIPG